MTTKTRNTMILLFALALSLAVEPAFAQVAGGNDWVAGLVGNLVAVILVGVVELAVLYYAGQMMFGHHYVGGLAAAAVGALVLVKYTTVAGWITAGIGALGGLGGGGLG